MKTRTLRYGLACVVLVAATVSYAGAGGCGPASTFGVSETGGRSVAENAAVGAAVGVPLGATDPDGDTLTYSHSGADAASFTIDTGTGQLRVGVALDFETKPMLTSDRVGA